MSEETKAKISAAARGRKLGPMSEEHKAKIAAAKIKYYEKPGTRSEQSERMQSRPTSHGMVKSGAYRSWYAMKQRVLNPNNAYYQLYGGRGITIDPRWVASFVEFHKDMGDRSEKLTLERIDTDGNYEPGNCRWATWSEQRLNQRRMKKS